MFNCLPLIVLLAACPVEFIVPTEPVEDVLVSSPCAFEKWIFTMLVLFLQSLEFVLLENLKDFLMFHLSSCEDWSLAPEVLMQAALLFALLIQIEDLLSEHIVAISACYMKSSVATNRILSSNIQVFIRI